MSMPSFSLIKMIIADATINKRISDSRLEAKLDKDKCNYKIKYIKTQNRQVRYLKVNGNKQAAIVLVHGAPSSLSASYRYFTSKKLLQLGSVISYDRPGYGYSGFGNAMVNIEQQAKVLKAIVEDANLPKNLFVIGTSFGAPIAARFAMDYPDDAKGLILTSAAVAPGHEKVLGISRVLNWSGIRWLVPKILRVANDEKLSHEGELKLMEPLWKDIDMPILMIHGSIDRLVYPSNLKFVKSKTSNSLSEFKMIEGRGHLISYTMPKKIIEMYWQFIGKILQEP